MSLRFHADYEPLDHIGLETADFLQLPISPNTLLQIYRQGLEKEFDVRYGPDSVDRINAESMEFAVDECYCAPSDVNTARRTSFRPDAEPVILVSPGGPLRVPDANPSGRRRHQRSTIRKR